METVTNDRDVWELPRLDKQAVGAEAQRWLRNTMAGHGTLDAEARARTAARLGNDAVASAETLRALRDQAAYTVTTQWNVRRGASIPMALGMNRTRWQRIKTKQAQLDLEPTEDALNAMPTLARDVEFHTQVAAHARVVRDTAAHELLAAGRPHAEIAEMIGLDRSRVSHLKAAATA